MIYKMVSSKAVLAKVIADMGLSEEEFPITDCKQWLSEGLMQIGSVNQLDHKVVVLPICGYQAKLPCDLERLNSVAYSVCKHGGWIPMKKTTGTFSVYNKKADCDCCKMLVHDDALIPIIKNMNNLVNDKEALDILNKDVNTRQTLSCLINNYTVCSKNGRLQHPNTGDTNFSYRPQYDIKPGFLIANVPEGYVKISYHAIYTDEDGMPMIPDLQSYFEACFWYCAQKILYIKYIKGEVNRQLWLDAKTSWNYYRKQAYAESLLPNQDELTNLKYTWNTLVPEIDEERTYFSTTGDRQEIYNQDLGGYRVWR